MTITQGLESALRGALAGVAPLSAPPLLTDPAWSLNRSALRAATRRTDHTPGLRVVPRYEQVPT